MKAFLEYAALGAVLVLIGVFEFFWPWHIVAQAVTPPAAVATTTLLSTPPAPTPRGPVYPYITITNSCGPYFGGDCVQIRSGPGTGFPAVGQLRDNMILKVASTTVVDGQTWYKIGFGGDIRYPERIKGDWYVSGAYAKLFHDPGEIASNAGLNASSTKRIEINLTKQELYAYDGDTLFMQEPVSTGITGLPTPVGKFWIYRKIPDSYMQGPIPGLSDQYYDLPGVPWDMYFTAQGAAIHGAYWHNHFGEEWSHGCVNLPPDQARILYEWAPLGTPVTVTR